MLKPLTSLRFLAAMLVFARHCPVTLFAATRFQTGDCGVEFFFVLSGFILTFAHRELLDVRLDFSRIKDFWVARFARIYPVHVLAFCFAMFLVTRSFGIGWFWKEPQINAFALLLQATLTQSWIHVESLVGFNAVAWSISDEAFFYAVFPFAALLLLRIAGRSGARGLTVVALALWLLSFAVAASVRDEWLTYNFPPIRLLDFLVGACAGAIFSLNLTGAAAALRLPPPPPARRSRWGPPMTRATMVEAAVVAGAVVSILAMPHIPAPFRTSVWLAPFSAAVIYVFALGEGALSQALRWKPLIYLGEISYNFYMLHALLLIVIFAHTGAVMPWVTSAISLILCVAVSTIVFERYERPLRESIRRTFSSRAPAVAAA